MRAVALVLVTSAVGAVMVGSRPAVMGALKAPASFRFGDLLVAPQWTGWRAAVNKAHSSVLCCSLPRPGFILSTPRRRALWLVGDLALGAGCGGSGGASCGGCSRWSTTVMHNTGGIFGTNECEPPVESVSCDLFYPASDSVHSRVHLRSVLETRRCSSVAAAATC